MKRSVALLLLVWLAPLMAQTVSSRIEGRVLNNGAPAAGVQVVLTNQTTSRAYKLKTASSGAFEVFGVAPGNDYTVEVFSPAGESLFRRTGVSLPAQAISWTIDLGNDARTDIGGIKATARQPQYTAEQIEEMKRQRERALNENALITQANSAMTSRNFQAAIAPLQQLISLDPKNWQYYSGLGDAQLNLGQYEQAAHSYQNGISAAQNTPDAPGNPLGDPTRKKAGIAKMLTNEGNAYLKLHKNKEAVDAYTQAAALDPNPATAYFNLCATQYNSGNSGPEAIAACDKAIQFNPNKADAYFIKGSLLMANVTQDAQGRMTAPPGTAEALQKYLQLAPNGQHAKDSQEMLAIIGAKIETTYSTKKKK